MPRCESKVVVNRRRMKAFREVGVTLDRLLEEIGSLVCVVDKTGRVLYANQHWLQAMGYAADDLDAVDFFAMVRTANQDVDFLPYLRRLEQGESVTGMQFAMVTRSGVRHVVEGSFIPQVENGQLIAVTGIWQDVSGHKARETELDRIFQLSLDILGITDFDGAFLKVNPAVTQVLGYSPEELIGKRFIDFVHPDDRQHTLEVASVAFSGQPVLSFENRYRSNQGTYRWLSWNSTTKIDERRVYFVARDITARKLTEARLYEANEQLQAILENAGALITLKDLMGRYILANGEFERLVGRSVNNLTDVELFDAKTASVLEAHDRSVMRHGVPQQFEETLPTTDGIHTFLSTKVLLHDADGSPYAVCSISTDITYRKRTEMQLSLRNKAIEASPTCISIADASLPDLPLIYINPAFEKTTGYSAIEVIGRNCRFLQGDDRDQPGVTEIRQALREERGCNVVVRNYRKNGSLFYNELRLAPIHDEQGRLTHYVGISQDVTDRVETDEKLQTQNEVLLVTNSALALARRQAEEATRLKSQFLATMSHELRTPLNAIIGYTEIQLAGMAGDLTSEQKDYQKRVLANAEHLLDLINDVLDISKIEAGRMELVNKPFVVADWLDAVATQITGLTTQKDLRLEVSLDPRMPRVIVADGARIKQIALNLLSNSIKFTQEGYIRLQVQRHGRDAWKLVVSDSGIGIPSHMQETIFEEFRQVDSSSARKQGGTGLGLAIVRKLCLMMGGNVRVQSQLGKGSVFTVTLPLNDEMPDAAPEERPGGTHDQ